MSAASSALRSSLTAVASAVGIAIGFTSLFAGTFPLFLKPVASDLSWNRTTVSSVLTVASILYAVANPFVGRAADRLGVRTVVLPGLVIYGGGLIALSRLNSSVTLAYLLFSVIGVASAMCGLIPFIKVISATFHERRGLMLGLVIGGAATVGAAVAVPVARYLIVGYGWRQTYIILGAAVLITFPLLFASLREPMHAAGHAASSGVAQIPGTTVRQAVASAVFWEILISMLLVSIATFAFRAHSFAWLTDRHVSGAVATFVVSVVALSGLIGQVISGALLDRVHNPKVAIPFFAASAIGLGWMLYAERTWSLLGAAVVFGAGIGTQATVMPYFASRYFGFRSYSEIVGYLGASIAVGSGAGAVLMGIAFDRLGSYRVALGGCEALLILGALSIVFLGPYIYSVKNSEGKRPESGPVASAPPEGARAGAQA